MKYNELKIENLDIFPDAKRLVFKNRKNIYSKNSNIDFNNVISAFGIALHMHQPIILESPNSYSKLISNLWYMMENQHIGDNHNAPIFYKCYYRMSDFIKELVSQNKNPRVMLDYSGNLLWALENMESGYAIEKLKEITIDKNYNKYIEWLGTTWSHSVIGSTPVPDIKLQVLAWRAHFASIFGLEALKRIKGFSAPEMQLPIHPDVCYEYIKTLKECGYEWLMVQEHTIENLDGSSIKNPYFPHRLIAKNSEGETEEITILIKTKGSDTKLVGQMQPYYEAKTKTKEYFCGKKIPPYVLQIGDGENGGVMMNEFPQAYKLAFSEITTSGVVGMNGSEYLEFLKKEGIKEKDLSKVQPIFQHRIWELVVNYSKKEVDRAIDELHKKDPNFVLDKGSWTNDKSWIRGYEDVLSPMNKLSVAFHKKFDNKKINKKDKKYKEALLYLLLSQTSDFRYWGVGIWTEYAKEIIRRGFEALK